MNPFSTIMNPRSIAIAGANNSPMKMGTMHAMSILKDGYKGSLYPLHPKEEIIAGMKAYKSPLDLPEAPDLAFLVVPAPQVVQLMDEFGKIGTRHAVIISAGFRETGEEGKELERALRETADKHGMRFVGPNCMGIINSEISLNTTVVPLNTPPGKLGFASQSGTYITQTIPMLTRRGIRFSKAVSVGNEADISIIDALEYLGEDKQTGAISLYIEGIRDIPRFLEVARSITPKKPVLAQYVGGSAAGARSGMGHTGALAGPDHLYDGLFKQAGIIRVDSVEDLYGQGWALATQPPLRGNRIGITTNSGGPGTAMADVLDREGLQVPRFSDALRESMKEFIPRHAPSGNPVDVTYSIESKTLTEKLPRVIMESGEVDGILVHGIMMSGFVKVAYEHIKDLIGGRSVEEVMNFMFKDISDDVQFPWKYGIPMCISSFFYREDEYIRIYEDSDIPVYDSPEQTAGAMVAMDKYRLIRQRPPQVKKKLPEVSTLASGIIASLNGAAGPLDEHQSKMLLGAYGIPVTEEVLARDENQAVAAAESMGYPAVMKACGADIPHKTERGLVRLNIRNGEEARTAFRHIRERAPEVPVLVTRMIQGTREFIAGITRHDAFGPSVLFGVGGIYAEAIKDVTFRTAPLTFADALEMLDDIRSSALLKDFRGMEPADRESLATSLVTLGEIALLHREISEIDINPIILEGSRPVVADALVVVGTKIG